MKKIKVMTISDMPFSVSGVAHQTKIFIESLLKTGEFEIVSLGGLLKHDNYNPIKTKEYGDAWITYPVDKFGTPDIVRTVIKMHKPDVLWFMTDPRYFEWLWAIEDEIRPLMPMVYYHVWDNHPAPLFNKPYYDSTDKIVTISKVTDEIVSEVSPETDREYLPHSVHSEVFKAHTDEVVDKLRTDNLKEDKDKFIFFWNNRNARRKLAGTVIYWFGKFLDEVGHDKAKLIMHTEPHDPNGPNLTDILSRFGLDKGQVSFSTTKMPPEQLAMMYNLSDCTINISDAEGFGLSTLESLSCERPVIVNKTGGLKEQITDGKCEFGVGIDPASQIIVGTQNVPYIYEDRVAERDFVAALKKMYEMSPEDRRELGRKGRAHVVKNYNFESIVKRWPELIKEVHKKYGSWDTRKGYALWKLKEV